MPDGLAREIGLLRQVVVNLERRPLPSDGVTQEFLRREGLGHVSEKAGGITSIRAPAHHAFNDLTDCLIKRLPAMERGATYLNIRAELLGFIEVYLGRESSSVGRSDVTNLIEHFEKWFADSALLRHVFIPCMISRTPAPRFEIGPVTFEHIDRVAQSDFYPRSASEDGGQFGFGQIVKWMRERDSNWLARVAIHGCEQDSAQELAELSVDLAIVALQLAAPQYDTRIMARLDAKRGTQEKYTLSEVGGFYNWGWTKREPGMPIGPGLLPEILKAAAPIVIAVGNIVRSFASGSFRLPVLERAWCDAAYWLNQALVESIDNIAIVKLETALEVLLGEETASGSEKRMLKILKAFFGLEQNDIISPFSAISAKKYSEIIVENRSRILHGTWSTLKARGINRVGMEAFVISVLRMAAVELEAYASSSNPLDNVDKFLDWVRLRKASL